MWLIVDCPKPWNGKIQKSSGFPAIAHETADALMSRCGVGVLGRTGVLGEPSLTCYAFSQPGAAEPNLGLDHVGWVEVHIPLDRTDLLAVLGQADWSQLDFRPATPALYVCTHGSRDSCCGRLGVPVLQAFREQNFPGPVYDCSHLGGHRFAATLLAFPQGRCYGRVDVSDVPKLRAALECGEDIPWLRGQTAYEPGLQIVDAQLKAQTLRVTEKSPTPNGFQLTFEGDSSGTATFTEETVASIQSCADIPAGQAKGSQRIRLQEISLRPE